MAIEDLATPRVLGTVVDALITDEKASSSGVWLAAAGHSDFRFYGAEFWVSCDGGTTYKFWTTVPRSSKMGGVLFDIDAPVDSAAWDAMTTIGVQLVAGELESTTREIVSAECQNIAHVGGEVLGFTTVNELAENLYEISDLLRCLKGTSPAAAIGEEDYFVVVDPTTMVWAPLAGAKVGATIYYKACSPGSDLDDIEPKSFVFQGNSCRNLAPINLTGTEEDDDSIVFSWDPRSRYTTSILTPTSGVLANMEPEVYEVKLLTSVGSVIRTTEVSDARTWTWTTSMQTADGFTPGGGKTVTIVAEVRHIGLWRASPEASLEQDYGLDSI